MGLPEQLGVEVRVPGEFVSPCNKGVHAPRKRAVFFVGAADLSLSLGLTRQLLGHPRV
jgi:hypothetical protein